ncbi:MAG: MFS transporter [Planctomycetaceae bacterium]
MQSTHKNMHLHWYRELNSYQWFVLVVAALGWLFDTMDQQLFNLSRLPAMQELLTPSNGILPPKGVLDRYGGIATAIFLIGWATGGLVFGVLGDRIGRARTMMLTILAYSLFTGLSAFSRNFWDFAIFRFLTGLGVGGEFAVGISLVAEVMPDRARPFALGFLQALSALGSISAAAISILLGQLESTGVIENWQLGGVNITAWRAMFLIGTLPALLALLIRKRLKEPEQWERAVHSLETQPPESTAAQYLYKPGSYAELFSNHVYRKHAILGLLLATSGVIGLWGIGLFSIDLNQSVFRKVFEQEARSAETQQWDRDLIRVFLKNPDLVDNWKFRIRPLDLLNSSAQIPDAQPLYSAMVEMTDNNELLSIESILRHLDEQGQTPSEREHRSEYLSGTPVSEQDVKLVEQISERSQRIRGNLTKWSGYTSIMMNLGGFFGIYSFSLVTHFTGRRLAFALSFTAAGFSTAGVFGFWMN